MNKVSSVVLVAGLALGACGRSPPSVAPAEPPKPAPVAEVVAPPEPTVAFEVRSARIRPNQTVAAALVELGLPMAQVNELVGALSGVFDVRKSRPGDQLRLTIGQGQPEMLEYRASFVNEWHVRREGERMVGGKREVEVEKRVAPVALTIENSLYEAMLEAGEDPSLAMAIADVLAWDVDFYQDVRKGDRVPAVVEKYVSKGRVLRYGEVLAASYEGASVGNSASSATSTAAGEPTYFDEDGNSAKKTFLKSPLKYANVTSGFGGRFHPVLQYHKAAPGRGLRGAGGHAGLGGGGRRGGPGGPRGTRWPATSSSSATATAWRPATCTCPGSARGSARARGCGRSRSSGCPGPPAGSPARTSTSRCVGAGST